MTLWIAGPDGQEYEPLALNDVSLGGLAFRSDVSWNQGDTVKVYVNVDRPMELEATVQRCSERSKPASGLLQALSRPHFDVAITFSEPDPEQCREVVGQIFRSEVYHRGLYG